jgi:outer membrane protein TolC
MHNATMQSVILAVEQAYFDYNAAKAVRDAQLATVREDSANLAAAKARHAAGVGTISDVLQAQTVLSQAELDLETADGSVQTTRGALAIAIGVPATVSYDIQAEPPQIPIAGITQSVDSLVERAVRSRPDLAAYRAQARSAAANVGAIRGQGLPSLFLSGTGGHTYDLRKVQSNTGNIWTAQLGVSIPIFQGFQTTYGTLQAQEQAKASAANAEYQRDQVVYQVFTAYYNLRTATAHVHSADDLLASAQQSYNVARGKYKEGVGSILDLLTAEAALASARSQQAQARWTWYSTLAQLSHDVGVIGIHGEPLLQLNTPPGNTR